MIGVAASLSLIAFICQVFPGNCETSSHLHEEEPPLPNIDLRTLYVLMNKVITELKDFKHSTNDAFLHVGTQLRSQGAVLKNHGDVLKNQGVMITNHGVILHKQDQNLEMLLKKDKEDTIEINRNSKAIEEVATILKDDIKNITKDVRVVKEVLTNGKCFVYIAI